VLFICHEVFTHFENIVEKNKGDTMNKPQKGRGLLNPSTHFNNESFEILLEQILTSLVFSYRRLKRRRWSP
jgi:hypothetical protein